MLDYRYKKKKLRYNGLDINIDARFIIITRVTS